ncbi:hypothetical protein F1C58_03920 [Glaciihabitans sp. INWT7]|uniref:hypothetical protein n=1 Tax=Glaciihabitans sp. INWT7 TaxID=2596912 RepID=UPI0016236EF5|nr:hypothetical protein [Glaciihabitans sp. INWT7]QNE46140.1 hypothetical protein F1C58_03920 [Glaciihabitans sp. INWT7]
MAAVGHYRNPVAFFAIPALASVLCYVMLLIYRKDPWQQVTRGLYGRVAFASLLLFIPAALAAPFVGPFMLGSLSAIYLGVRGRNRWLLWIGAALCALSISFGYPIAVNLTYIVADGALPLMRTMTREGLVESKLLISIGLLTIVISAAGLFVQSRRASKL